MRILVFSQYYSPERFLITEILEKLVEEGHEVTVITGLPCYGFPNGEVLEEYKNNKKSTEIINGVSVFRCNVKKRGKGMIQRLRNYLSYPPLAQKVAQSLKDEFDVVFVYQLTPVMVLKPAIDYCRKNNKKLFCYCLDLAPESGMRLVRRIKPLAKLYARNSAKLYSGCDRIGVTSKGFIPYMERVNGIPGNKLFHLPQHAPEWVYHQDLSKIDNGEKTFYFAGNLGKGASLETLLEAAQLLKQRGYTGFSVRFIGNGFARADLIKRTEEMKLNDVVKFENAVPMEEMAAVYKNADALLITLRKNQITVPAKLQTYMATGKPVFGAMDGSGKDLIHEANCGRCADAEDAIQLCEYMADYLDSPEKYKEMGENGKDYFINHFTLDRYINTLVEELTSLIKKQ